MLHSQFLRSKADLLNVVDFDSMAIEGVFHLKVYPPSESIVRAIETIGKASKGTLVGSTAISVASGIVL
jgi:uncharacterized protein YfeS